MILPLFRSLVVCNQARRASLHTPLHNLPCWYVSLFTPLTSSSSPFPFINNYWLTCLVTIDPFGIITPGSISTHQHRMLGDRNGKIDTTNKPPSMVLPLNYSLGWRVHYPMEKGGRGLKGGPYPQDGRRGAISLFQNKARRSL